MKYVKKPVVVEAFQWKDQEESLQPEWFSNHNFMVYHVPNANGGYHLELELPAIQGNVMVLGEDLRVQIDDYIIKDVKGGIYACKEEIFKDTYEEIVGDYIKIPVERE